MGKLARMRERGVEIFKNQNFLIILGAFFSKIPKKSLLSKMEKNIHSR